jgi:hypothetical protein
MFCGYGWVKEGKGRQCELDRFLIRRHVTQVELNQAWSAENRVSLDALDTDNHSRPSRRVWLSRAQVGLYRVLELPTRSPSQMQPLSGRCRTGRQRQARDGPLTLDLQQRLQTQRPEEQQ